MAGKGEDSPAMRQYRELVEKHAGSLVLYQMGDFFETFFDDAKCLGETLGITVTTRGDDSKGNPIAMAGFPIRALDQHLPRLLDAGLRVVIAEQTEDASEAKGLVNRDVTRIITPGTVLEDSLLDARTPSRIVAWNAKDGLAWAELSTGAFHCARVTEDELLGALARLEPRELILPERLWARDRGRLESLRPQIECALTAVPDFSFDKTRSVEAIKNHYGVTTLAGFGIEKETSPEVSAAGALLAYLIENQRGQLSHLRPPEVVRPSESMALDRATIDALEIVKTLRGGGRRGSLLDSIDQTRTPMGARTLRSWLMSPLTDATRIKARHAAVNELTQTAQRMRLVAEALAGFPDLERLAGRLGTGRGTPRDLDGLRMALRRLPQVANALKGAESSLLAWLSEDLDTLDDVTEILETRLADDPPMNLKDGGVIRAGLSSELDETRDMLADAQGYIERFRAQEADRTGIPGLKVGFNNVFGYYIEVTHAHTSKVPEEYTRKQTLKAAERYITPELKEFESKILSAEKRIHALESRLFSDLRAEVTSHSARLLASAQRVAAVDVLCGLADVARARGWVRPLLDDSTELDLREARHPVLEQSLDTGSLVPNDAELTDARLAIVTGPNMAGKSTYVRTVALAVLMAQAGSFVPAKSARIGVVDRIFTRLGSSDDIASGQSTFMVEMAETANILNFATEHSLIILDEVGRGTSTFDGVSIAWAVSEFILQRLRARTFFATHYHELTQLALKFPEVQNLNVAVREWKDELVFLHKIVPGAADRSYGIHVAKLAGIPPEVVTRSDEILKMLEADSPVLSGKATRGVPAGSEPRMKKVRGAQLSLFTVGENKVIKTLRDLDTSAMAPEVALAEILKLQNLAREQG